MRLLLIVGLGGFMGSSVRYIIQKYFAAVSSFTFPYPTFFINLFGSLLIGILFGLASKYNVMSTEIRLFLTTGFCGGFTTFSTFTNESFILLKEGNYQYFFLYTILSVVLGIFLTFLGYSVFKVI
jgi:CrcB protein